MPGGAEKRGQASFVYRPSSSALDMDPRTPCRVRITTRSRWSGVGGAEAAGPKTGSRVASRPDRVIGQCPPARLGRVRTGRVAGPTHLVMPLRLPHRGADDEGEGT